MKKLFTVLSLLSFTSVLFPQTKYLIYFKDKGVSQNTKLMKSSELFEKAAKQLSPKAIERRKQVMGEDYYVTYEDLPINDSYVKHVEDLGIKIVHKLKWFNAVSCYLTDEQFQKVTLLPTVQKVEVIKKYTSSKPIEETQAVPTTDIKLNKSSAHFLDYGPSITQNELSEIPVVHDVAINGSGVIIGLLDTGFRWKSVPSLVTRNVIAEYDFIQNDSLTANQEGDASNQDSHGTSVFSIIGGYDFGNLIGPAYMSSYILAKTEYVPAELNIEEDNYAAALEWMEGLGVDITTSSLGYSTFDKGQTSYTYNDMNGNTTIVAKASNMAFDRGVSTFTSAGNEGDKTWYYISSPADAFNMIAVGAVDKNNVVTYYSSRGPTSDGRIKPELVTMGSGVWYALTGTADYENTKVGTSFAAPIAAGIAGLLKSAFPHLTNVQIRKIFLESCDSSTTPNNNRGYGLISAKKAITYPNLSQLDNQFILNKIFINEQGVNPSTVTLNYKIDNSSFQSVSMVYDNSLKYNFTFPQISQGQQVEFHFTYNTTSGSQVREPEGIKNYKFSYGDKQVSLFTDVNSIDELPEAFQLFQNYPNPFNPETVIRYQIPANSHVTLKVYDVLGREVVTLVDELKSAGVYNSTFKIQHSALSSGIYFYQLRAGNYINTKKMLLVK